MVFFQTLDVGDLSERLELKRRLGCHTFEWFLQNVYPEKFVYDDHSFAWGTVSGNDLSCSLIL